MRQCIASARSPLPSVVCLSILCTALHGTARTLGEEADGDGVGHELPVDVLRPRRQRVHRHCFIKKGNMAWGKSGVRPCHRILARFSSVWQRATHTRVCARGRARARTHTNMCASRTVGRVRGDEEGGELEEERAEAEVHHHVAQRPALFFGLG